MLDGFITEQMLVNFMRLVVVNLVIFQIYMFVIVPIHETGHMLAYKHYGVKSIIGFGSYGKANDVNKKDTLAYCRPLLEADWISFIEDDRKDAVVSFAGGAASVIFCLCMYMLFPLPGFLFVALWEGLYGRTEVKQGWAENERIRQGHFEQLWYLENVEEHKIFAEELSKYEGEGIIVPWLRADIRLHGFDLKEFE